MVSIANDAMNALRRAYTEREGNVDLAMFLLRFPELGDDELADLIELDARERLRAGLRVELSRYIDAIPDLVARRVALDAAIEFALRSLSGSRHTKVEAVEALCEAYPDLVPAISAAWFLNDALGSTGDGTALPLPAVELRLPMSIGSTLPSGKQRYELRERVGAGSHGSVYLAVDNALSDTDRPAWVAVKITTLRPGAPVVSQRVMEEATKARRVTHPNIARVLDRGSLDGGREFVVYEHVDAGDLQDAHDRGRVPRDHRDLARLVVKIARAVQAAHSAGLIHSDLKPSNILLTSAGEPKVADFGLAARRFEPGESGTTVLLGTLGFIAPERYRAEPGSEGVLSDVYSLGGILFYLLTGKPPNGSTSDDVADRLGAEPSGVRAPDLIAPGAPIDPDLAAICRRALAPSAMDRHPSADALANDIEAWLEHRPLMWLHPAKPRLARLFLKRNPVLCGAGAVLLVVLVAGTAGIMEIRAGHERRLLQASLDKSKAVADVEFGAKQQTKMLTGNFVLALRGEQKERLSADWLPFLTVVEAVAGPVLFAELDQQDLNEVWISRINSTRHLIAEAEQKGLANDSSTLLWRTGLGFWLLRDGHFADAEQELTKAANAWEARLGPDDSWTSATRALRACATIHETRAAASRGTLTIADRQTLATAAEELQARLKTIEAAHARSNMHREVLRSLELVYAPELLDEAEKRTLYTEQLARLTRAR